MTIDLLPNERLDELHRNGYKIIQNPERFCFGMDAVLLSGLDSGDKPAHGINGAAMQKSQNGSQRQRTEPPEELFVRGFQGTDSLTGCKITIPGQISKRAGSFR